MNSAKPIITLPPIQNMCVYMRSVYCKWQPVISNNVTFLFITDIRLNSYLIQPQMFSRLPFPHKSTNKNVTKISKAVNKRKNFYDTKSCTLSSQALRKLLKISLVGMKHPSRTTSR